jgi:PEP-CTERM motif
MLRHSKIQVLPAFLWTFFVAFDASASPVLSDPIVRTRKGGSGSIQIFELPFTFGFASFPGNPDEDNCFVDSESAGARVSCEFQNLSGQTISLIDFDFTLGPAPEPLVFSIEDPDNLFEFETIDPTGARFFGGGIPSGVCVGDVEPDCSGGHFFLGLVAFPEGSVVGATASAVPEPATLTLVGAGLTAVVARRRRRRPA